MRFRALSFLNLTYLKKALAMKLTCLGKHCIFACARLFFTLLVAFTSLSTLAHASATTEKILKQQESDTHTTYTMNFRDIAIIEYIRFVSRITGLNFIFNESDLPFKVTILSEKPVTKRNVVSALIQILEINGMSVTEQGSSLLISKGNNAQKIGQVIIGNTLPSGPIVTRIFQVRNLNIATLTGVIKSLASSSALIETVMETRQILVTDSADNIDKIDQLLQALEKSESPFDINIYHVKNVASSDLVNTLQELMAPFHEGNVYITLPQIDKNIILIVSTPNLIAKSLDILAKIDIPAVSAPLSTSEGQQLFFYQPKYKNPKELFDLIHDTVKNLKKNTGSGMAPILAMLNTGSLTKEGDDLSFIGNIETWTKVLPILEEIDGSNKATKLWIYSLQQATPEAIEESLQEMADKLEDSDTPESREFIEAIDNMRYVASTRSFIFIAGPLAIARLQTLLPMLDKPMSTQSSFYIYAPKYASASSLRESMLSAVDNTVNQGIDNSALRTCIDSSSLEKDKNLIVFSGSSEVLTKVKELASNLDVPGKLETNIFLYKPQNLDQESMLGALTQIVDSLDTDNKSNYKLAKCLKDAEWLADTHAFLFRADPETLDRVKQIVSDIDSPENPLINAQTTFYLYKLQNALGSTIEAQLQNMASQLPNDTPQARAVVESLRNVKWIHDNNSLLISGSPPTIEKVVQLITQFDVASENDKILSKKEKYFIYTPKYHTAEETAAILKEYTLSFQGSGLTDKDLLTTLDNVQVVIAHNQLIFAGSSGAIDKVKDILATIDSPDDNTDIHRIGKLSFMIYHLTNLPPKQFLHAMGEFVNNMKRNGAISEEVASSIEKMHWIKDTNSMMFIGHEGTLHKVLEICKKIDVPGVISEEAINMTYEIYTPKYQNGSDLIEMLCEFTHNLMNSGIQDQQLTSAVNNVKWIAKTNTLIISGSQDVITRIKGLLERFDVASNNPQPQLAAESSFLVYKIQFHSGDVIQQSLRKLANSFSVTGTTPNPALASAIESLQWIQVTNTLLASGDPEALARLKNLIADIDVPLRQVFIEVLVIETNVDNTQNFGLQWAGKGQYLNRVSMGTNNFLPASTSSSSTSSGTNAFANSIANIPAIGPNPNANSIPQTIPGFDLGVIGDVILHKGKSFLSLGSFINAIQTDTDATIVMNPKIIAQDNNNSTIFIGQNVPYVGSVISNTTVNPGVNGTLTTSNIEYKDVGSSLSITPTIGQGDVLTMDITYSLSSIIANTVVPSSSSVQGVQTSQANMTTRVHVPDRHFLVLSGMLVDTRQLTKQGIPCLGSIPVLGLAFSDSSREDTKTNIIIFMRPQIIHNFDEYQAITEYQEDLYRDQSVKKTMKEAFDAGLNWVKTPENE